MREIFTVFFMLFGAAFMCLAALGVFRMPDLFTRIQTATKASTLGAGALLLAVAIHFAETAITARAILIIAFIFFTAPVAAHTIARAAYVAGVKLWSESIVDELSGKERESETESDEPGQPPEGPFRDVG